jgi:predicted small integral membrane protein
MADAAFFPPGTKINVVPGTAPTVYLAGPIAGLSYKGATDWRDQAIASLAEAGIRGLSPMRAKEYLRGAEKKMEHPYPVGTRVQVAGPDGGEGKVVGFGEANVSYYVEFSDELGGTAHWHRSKVEAIDTQGFSATCEEYGHLSPLSSPRGIMTRDRFDATRCDVLLVNLLGAAKVSIGTVMEIAWADLKRTPIVACIEATGNPHEHCMVNEAVGFRCTSLDEGLHVVRSIL